jgi:hypothetical protein
MKESKTSKTQARKCFEIKIFSDEKQRDAPKYP